MQQKIKYKIKRCDEIKAKEKKILDRIRQNIR